MRRTHANQVYRAWAVGLMLRSRPGNHILFGLPLFHVGDALTQGLTTFATGTCLLAGLAIGKVSIAVTVGLHPTHGSLIEVGIAGAGAAGEELKAEVGRRLAPLVMRHLVTLT